MISCGGSSRGGHTAVVTEDGQLFAFGCGSQGQLGTGQTDACTTGPKKVGGVLENLKVTRASCGGVHTVVLAYDGSKGGYVYAFGSGAQGQLGDGSRHLQSLPVKVKLGHKVKSIAAGEFHSAAVTADGLLYTWGSNSHGQLGIDQPLTSQHLPLPVGRNGAFSAIKIKEVACGARHTLAVSCDEQIYSWGYNGFGQLGHGDHADRHIPSLIDSLAPQTIKAISGGGFRSCALTTEGVAYTWGQGVMSSEAIADSESETLKPLLHSTHYSFQNTSEPDPLAALGWARTTQELRAEFAARKDAEHRIEQHSTLHALEAGNKLVPTKVGGELENAQVDALLCGEQHFIALTGMGVMYTWGSNKYGALGNSSQTIDLLLPTPVREFKDSLGRKLEVASVGVPVSVAGGGSHSSATMSNGRLFFWGCAENGQLGASSMPLQLTPIEVDLAAIRDALEAEAKLIAAAKL